MHSTLMIKDLSITEELDSKAMSAVRGGSAISVVGGNSQNVVGGGGFASPTTGLQVGPTVNTTDASSHLNLSIPTVQNFGGAQGVLL
ncbi:hypothetical protein [Paraburkholderia phenazinium]|jgi:hypothetical protein|uniref:Uncharacterized protein n=1 Tax=Paraburkholderia phenazinium TaxID=60549 RepID=A0A1G7RWT5_9BURK|nr:hypothetical protein [Paraburkholderia phenazinium]SDG15201.1 hypothetical protein SAMN05216466_102293 [Paraburkholderia phenazinium]